ncbi:MAG TPA: class I SAM-dependent methyltransferase, partial [Myxococcales bacterium]|nr:class I SAM-dependent methyltransferase [Myxococcales bacterium]
MGFYDRFILPHLVNCACGGRAFARQRELVVPKASGRVIEIGLGSGLNLPLYSPQTVSEVVGLEPSPSISNLAKKRMDACEFPVSVLESKAEEIELESGSFDTVLVTYTLCTIEDPAKALKEMARLLKADGQLLFCEHGLAPDESVVVWQRRINPIWGAIGGGCRLDSDIPALISQNGFALITLDDRETGRVAEELKTTAEALP